MKRITQLESLRGIFILLIVIHHYYIKFGNSDLANLPFGNVAIFQFIYQYGWLGVEYFFMVSGFGLALKYYEKSPESIGTYIIGRLKKIWPVAAVAELMNAAFYVKNISFTRLFRSIFLIQFGYESTDKKPYNGITWFLDVLFICYVLFFCIRKVAEKSKSAYLILSGTMCVIGMISVYKNIEIPLLFSWNGRGYLAFFGGVLLALIYKNVRETVINKYSIAISVIIVIVCICTIRRGISEFIGGISDFRFMLSAFFLPNIMIISSTVPVFKRILELNIFQWMGKISTYIFLFQPFVYMCLYVINGRYKLIDFSRIRGMLFVLFSLYVFSFVVMKIHMNLATRIMRAGRMQ